ncbi:MAG TPA: hypothetical protein VGJ78_25095 [Vicinamibacterales bacterium]|jgi:hypothetical protein
MRTTTFVVAALFALSGVAVAQEWADYSNTRDGFKITFPGQPAMSTTTWTSEHGYTLPGRVYTVDKGREHYSVTVVDYSGIEQLGLERAKQCPPRANVCAGNDLAGIGFWKHDVRGALVYASHKLMERDAKLTDFVWSQHDLVEGHELQLTNNSDQSRTYAYVAMHEMKLYIVEATVPRNAPPATLFQTSMGWVDKDGKGIRYQIIYSNEFHGMKVYPVPPVAGGAPAGGGAGAAQ